MKTIKTKNLKPIDFDAHFKYKCPKCSCDHWLSYRQAKTEHFKVVCDCDAVFEVKRIKTLKLCFVEPEAAVESTAQATKTQEAVRTQIPKDTLTKCTKILIGYGFTKEESEIMLDKAYQVYPVEDCATLIKLSVGNTLGEQNG